ncbi:nitrile hydratase subunit beta [Pseudonocardia hydrocarbonoxydans]|uniref:Nitrile hydratase subunit beta n=1 Tax=Pseudonocardia hydrocarbonoxydans TaxID=76726 RepID=A0A4Y3WKF1_9PSEU|nr:nitrile hydratase subunit beta [Pseudonocardia hydrocarbonoxydans]GEC18721.1 nitrile hydratase subunit beta [Pseudonocardia hydrocarbonoxydans]
MNGVHDLGGTDGLGPVPVPESEPVFRAEWEKAAFAMFSMPFRAGFFGVDMFRHGIEKMHPAVYLLSPYYEHWMHAAEHYGVAKGVLDEDEIEKRTQYFLENPDAPLPEREDPDLLAFVDWAVQNGVPAGRPSDKVAKFAVGDRVTVSNDVPYGHTRKARYISGRTGVIELAHGTMIYPDSAGNGGDDAPEHVYTVKFTSTELWGAEAAEPNGVVYFDVWEPYITHATSQESAA